MLRSQATLSRHLDSIQADYFQKYCSGTSTGTGTATPQDRRKACNGWQDATATPSSQIRYKFGSIVEKRNTEAV